jgi:hypothetical protein
VSQIAVGYLHYVFYRKDGYRASLTIVDKLPELALRQRLLMHHYQEIIVVAGEDLERLPRFT